MAGRRTLGVLLVAGLAVASCSSDEGDSTSSDAESAAAGETYEVTVDVVSHETTQDIWVYAPDADGSWPVVWALHGTGGTGDGLPDTNTGLASQGYVVFSPTWRSEMDAECGYRYVMTIADQYGGDPDLGITGIGHSLGASVILIGGLDDATYGEGGTYEECFTGAPRPSVVVPIAGCYYEYRGEQFPFTPVPYAGQDVDITLVVGTDDTECEAWQSQDATNDLTDVGYTARLVEVEDGNHANVVFFEITDDGWVSVPDDPIGDEVVQIILDAIQADR